MDEIKILEENQRELLKKRKAIRDTLEGLQTQSKHLE
jgi:hypothetical protein